MHPYRFTVPEQKRIRVIVHTDCKNEADDQYALAHWLMTPMADIRGIVAAHFDGRWKMYGQHNTAQQSYDEVLKVLDLMGLAGKYPVALGAEVPMADEQTPVLSDGARLIIEEAMKEDVRPLYIACQGCLTDLASAILLEPRICERMTCIWIGGGPWPEGSWEFNLGEDRNAANVVFCSSISLWQVPMNVYKRFSVSLAELEYKVYPCGEIGKYLFTQLAELNMQLAHIPHWPHGELWGLGDQGCIAVLMQEREQTCDFTMQPAPRFAEDYTYIHGTSNREIRVYHHVDSRLTLEDFFCKLALNFRTKQNPI